MKFIFPALSLQGVLFGSSRRLPTRLVGPTKRPVVTFDMTKSILWLLWNRFQTPSSLRAKAADSGRGLKILVLRFSSMGDVVLTTPVVRAIKTRLPLARVHYATKPAYQSIFAQNPYVDRIHILSGKLADLVSELRQEEFDFIVDLHSSVRTHWLKFLLAAPAASFPKVTAARWLFINFKLNILPKVHIVDRYLSTLKRIGVQGDQGGLDYFIAEEDKIAIGSLPPTHREGYVCVVIGAAHQTKRLPTSKIIELCERLSCPVILIGGPQEADEGQKIEALFPDPDVGKSEEAGATSKNILEHDLGGRTVVYNGCGKYSIDQSASLLMQSRFVVSHDTGMMHIAAAFKKKIYGIWGPTSPAFGMYPYGTSFVVWENRDLGCRPCSKFGLAKCPVGHFKCMRELAFDVAPWKSMVGPDQTAGANVEDVG